ncbi:MAG: thioredoxin [Nanoarchaeota archaeon]|nr:thioredoxin [Nanoarchaeota archaeon]
MVTEITTIEQYNELKEKGTLVIDFWAPWCGPCKMYKPVFTKVSEEGVEGVTFATLNIDEEAGEEIAQEFGVTGIPYTALLKEGELVADQSGVMMKDQLVDFITKNQ